MHKLFSAGPPGGQTQKSLEYKVEVDRSWNFSFILKWNLKEVIWKVFVLLRSIKFSIYIRWFYEFLLV